MAGFDISSQSVFDHNFHPLQVENPNLISSKINDIESIPNETSNGAARKKRGRPLGAKNKAKEPMIITQESSNAIRAHLLEVQSGCDVFEALVSYTHKYHQGISLLSAVGRVTQVTLQDPTLGGEGIMPLHGNFEIISLSGTILPPPIKEGATTLTIYLAGGQARVVGGKVFGPLIACGPVLVIAAAFSFVAFEKLPVEINEQQVQNTQLFSGEGIVGYGENYTLGSTSRFPFLDMHDNSLDQWKAGQAPC